MKCHFYTFRAKGLYSKIDSLVAFNHFDNCFTIPLYPISDVCKDDPKINCKPYRRFCKQIKDGGQHQGFMKAKCCNYCKKELGKLGFSDRNY